MKKIGYFIVLLILVSACSKERIHPSQNLNEYASLNPYLNSKKVPEQEFEITNADDFPIVGVQGTKIWLPKSVLMFPEGENINFPYTVKLVELYKPKDMIYYQMPTVAQGKILETDGEIRVRAFKTNSNGDEQELVLKPECTFKIQMPSDSVRSDMKVFYGILNNNKPDWTSEKSEAGANEEADLYFNDLTSVYRANIGKLGWVNCGKPHQGFFKITFTSELDELSNVKTFCFLENYNTLIQAYNQTTCRMPDSSATKIVAMAIDEDNQLYCSSLSTVVTHSGSIPINLEEINNTQLTAILDSL